MRAHHFRVLRPGDLVIVKRRRSAISTRAVVLYKTHSGARVSTVEGPSVAFTTAYGTLSLPADREADVDHEAALLEARVREVEAGLRGARRTTVEALRQALAAGLTLHEVVRALDQGRVMVEEQDR